MSGWRPRRYRTELLLVFLGLFLVVQTAGFVVTRVASERNARAQIEESLIVAGETLARLMADRERHVLEAGRLLAGDFAFKATFATREPPTILSMLDNHRQRIEADTMILVSIEETTIADTLRTTEVGEPFGHPWLIDRALDDEAGEAAGVLFLQGRPFQFIVLPLLAPLHEAWIAVGFRLDDAFVAPLKSLSRAEVSLVTPASGRVHASTLAGPARIALEYALPDTLPEGSFALELQGREYLSLRIPIAGESEPIFALMMRPVDEALEPYKRLETILGALFLVGLLAAGAGAAMLARGVARPLVSLTQHARDITRGDYQQRVQLERRDELGELATAFNDMAHGLAERDRVRNLLGMVVSPQIADELLSREIQLGGEEREVTVMFADCRGYTTMSENLPPAEVLGRLNEMLTVLTEVIERHGGVVDKYIGDAVMALFGAPLANPDDPVRAVACALEMMAAMRHTHGGLQLSIGINTGRVVAGNMGSIRRLNYTVIGDTVNLASRVESLTRNYDADVLVTEATRVACGDAFDFRRVDSVTVKGRAAPVDVYEPRIRQPNKPS